MNLLGSRHQFNTDSNCLRKSIPTNNNININNNNNVDDVIFSDNKYKFTSDQAVIPKGTITGNIESDIVMVTYTFNGSSTNSSTSTLTTTTTTSTIKGSISGSTLPMRLRITGDQLILLRKESDIIDNDDDDDGLLSINNVNSNDSGFMIQFNLSKTGTGIGRRQIEEYRTVKLVREKSVGFGLSIKGGCEHGLPILISGLTREGPADRSRQLFIGDAIVRIDNVTLSLTTTTHEEAIRLLKQAGHEVNLTVKHFKMVSPFLTKCWRKRETLDNEAGNLMASTITTTTTAKNNNGTTSRQEKGKKPLQDDCDSNITKTNVNGSSGKLGSSSSSNDSVNNNNIKSDNNNNYGKEKGKVKKEVNVNHEKESEIDNWIPLISIDLGNCFITKYIHDSDKIRPQSFEIRWLTNFYGHSNRSNSCFPSSSTSSSSSSTSSTSGTSSSSSSTTSLSTPKSTDSGVGVGIKCASNSTITSMGNFKEPSSLIGGGGRSSKTYSSAIVICNNQQIYSQLFANIEKSVKSVTTHQMVTLNEHLPVNDKILFMGWINQGLPTSSSEPHRPCYHWYTRYLVIKGGDALIYIKPPQGLLFTPNDNNSSTTKTTTTTPTTSSSSTSSSSHPSTTNTIRWSEGQPYLFKAHQSVLRCLNPNEYVDERENCFLLLSCDTNYSSSATKSPLTSKHKTSSSSSSTTTTDHHPDGEKSDLTNNPIVTETSNESTTTATVCYFSVETPSELALIRNNWNRATYQSVTQLRSKSFPVTCSGKLGSLILDYQYGFNFSAATTGHPSELNNNNKQHNWSFKFSQLKTSSDDGRSTLWLSFRLPVLSSSSSSTSSPSSLSTSSRYEINKERLKRLTTNPNQHHDRSSETLTHSSTSSITVASDNPNLPTASSSSSSAGSLLPSTLNHHHQQSESIGKQFTIETREIKTNQLQHLLYCIHAFLTAKVISVDQSFIC
ncbi:serine-rich adhesin for platelets-like [Panonychus citri]|uniref:serine-rich adhesin for platelets-like n=1 Tax=Panonychus citri TaxID=50023 RepID=UPI002307F7F1|nr:serine-rich adhesin for platelets-like [Panonychus citri]